MKKWLAVAVLCGVVVFVSKVARADGNFTPVLVVSSVTGQGYLYSNSPSSSNPGGLLVNNAGGILQWTTNVIGSTTAATAFQLPAVPQLTLAQLQALTPATTGQLVMCTNCTNSALCISSGATTVSQFVAVSSGVATAFQTCK